MKKHIIFLITALLFMITIQVQADSSSCFIAKEHGTVIKQQGDCDQRHSPFSSFKVAIALMGFDSGILKDANNPKYPYREEYIKSLGFDPKHGTHKSFRLWTKAQTPKSWMRNSVVWYSQIITQKLGMTQFKNYATKFNYGNQDVSGSPGKNDGLLNAWLGTSLQISPREQVEFMEKLSNKKLAVSQAAQAKTIDIIRLENIWDDWQLYGKTGSGSAGWFVGWIEKGSRRIIFAQYFEDRTAKFPIPVGRLTKELAKDNLIDVIDKETKE